MNQPSQAPLPRALELLEAENEARRHVGFMHSTFQVRPSIESADAMNKALEDWYSLSDK
jgi:hypothetical protein